MTSASRNGDPVDRSQRFPDNISVPPEILARHGAKMLDPTTAVRGADGSRPLSCAYRSDTVLIPAGDVESLVPGNDNDYNNALARHGIELRRPEDPGWNEIVRGLHPDVGVAVPLVTREDAVAERAPDAWTALVALRTAFGEGKRARKLGLNHLLVAASLTVEGTPYTGGGSVSGSQGSIGAFALHTGDRNPVQVMAPQPIRRPASSLPFGRRPVIAVVDTGIGTHPWLPVDDLAADPVVEVAQEFQNWLADHEAKLALVTGATAPVLSSPFESRDEIQPLLGLTDSHSGHGTFVTGLIHQTCPDARVLSLRMLHTDGYSTEGSFLLALEWLRQRVDHALRTGDADQMVDVVSLSLGFYPESTTPAKVAQVVDAIERLTELGVVVVAAAGNDATTRPFLPAALGLDAAGTNGGNPLVAAIGALNASGVTTAAFSNAGQWISRWAPGNALVSTVPIWQGTGEPRVVTVDPNGKRLRTSPDEDDLTTGFAVWAGTSFATPVVAGFIGNALAGDNSAARIPPVDRAHRVLQVADDELAARGWR